MSRRPAGASPLKCAGEKRSGARSSFQRVRACTSVTAGWYGMRPMSPDGLPLVGTTETEGLYLHAGHGSIGMQAAPATARWLAELVAGDKQAPELGRLRPDRFS